MARELPLAAQLIADLFVAIEQDDFLATMEATDALAERIGLDAASAVSRALLADRRLPDLPAAPRAEPARLVACA